MDRDPVARHQWLGGWLERRLFKASAYADYALITVPGLAPLLLAWLLEAHRSVTEDLDGIATTYDGYWDRPNWLLMPLFLAVALLLLRWVGATMFDLEGDRPLGFPPLLKMFAGTAQDRIRRELRSIALSRRWTIVAAIITVGLSVVDVREVAVAYWDVVRGRPVASPSEKDWSVFFLTGRMSVEHNVVLVLLAYVAQAILVLLGCLLLLGVIRHNLYYLRLVYLRSQTRPEAECLVLDFRDARDRCFGLRTLNETFNRHLWLLVAAGLVMIVSRYQNVSIERSAVAYEKFVQCGPAKLPECLVMLDDLVTSPDSMFHDSGQWLLLAGWLVCSAAAFLPAVVKFLPILATRSRRVPNIEEYLLAFEPLSTKRMALSDPELAEQSRRFAENAFWPSGDERAQLAGYFASAVFLYMLMPLRIFGDRWYLFGFYAVTIVALSVGLTKICFAAFAFALRHVDRRLVERA